MADLPVRLNAGDPAPAEGVLVPLHGPGTSIALSWEQLVDELRQVDWPSTAAALQAIADAAEAEPPLKKGNRVRVEFEGEIVDPLERSGPVPAEAVFVLSTFRGSSGWVLPEHVTRIEDPAPAGAKPRSAECVERWPECFDGGYDPRCCRFPKSCSCIDDPAPATVVDRAIDDALASDDPPERLSSEDVRQALKVAWTPAEGMLVERISDGACFILQRRAPKGWNLTTRDGLVVPRWAANDDSLMLEYRPRCLRVGDVIEKVEWKDGTESPHYHDTPIEGMGRRTEGETWIAVEDGRFVVSPCVIHVKGLGPVPWPPKEEI